MLSLFSLLVLATGCDDKDMSAPDTGLSSTATDSDRTTDDDSGASTDVPSDRDGDGFTVAEGDCDDDNPARNPAAEERCNGVDDDCDDRVDDDDDDVVDASQWFIDTDGDGYGTAGAIFIACEQPMTSADRPGDCDDANAAVNPAAEETCNEIDDDCDGLVDDDDDDLVGSYTWYPDADSDGYGEDGGEILACEEPSEPVLSTSGDCDDNDAEVNPDALEICDDIDNDCDGTIDGADATGTRTWYADVDSDSYGDATSTTTNCSEPSGYCSDDTDCDDGDPNVNPGATDWYDDGVDSDCDGADGGVTTLPGDNTYVDGATDSLSGWSVDLCDLDADGLDDAVVSAPFEGGDYSGQVGVFYGSSITTWGSSISLSDADVVITGSPAGFLGYNVRCGDLDGDGLGDLVIANGEVHSSAVGIDTDWEVDLFYGRTAGWPSAMDQADADAVLVQPMGAPSDGSVNGNIIELADLDGDGAMELVVLFYGGSSAFTVGEAWVLAVAGGSALSGQSTLEAEAWWTWIPSDQDTFDRIRILDDLDGGGTSDVTVFQAGWNGADTDSGQVMWVGDATTSGQATLDDVATGSIEGDQYALYFGLTGASGDFDGDGAMDLAVSAYGDETGTRSYPGSVYLFSDSAAYGTLGYSATDTADALVLGTQANGYLGFQIRSAGDANGDGADDLFAVEYQGGSSYQGALWLMGGSLLSGTSDVDEVTLLTWEGSSTDGGLGREIAIGDLDGDGLADALVGSPYSDSYQGRVYFILSSDW